jgi:hypothetical protein
MAEGHWCTTALPDVSLRGAKRRGNLAVFGWIAGSPRRNRNCFPVIAPQGHFLALCAQGATLGLLAMTNLGALRHRGNMTHAASLCCHRYIAPIISYPHAHIQVRPLVDSPAGRKAVDILLCIVDRQRKGADFDVVIRVKFAICIVSGSQIPTELIL